MAFSTDEKAALAAHLRFMRALCSKEWIEGTDIDAVLDAATSAQQTAALADLPTLDRLRAGLASVDSRFKVSEIVGELKFRDDEVALRSSHYAKFLLQLGFVLNVASTPNGGRSFMTTNARRGW